MWKYVFDWSQSPVLLKNFEKVRAELAGDVGPLNLKGAKGEPLIDYLKDIDGRPNVIVSQHSFSVTLLDGDDTVTLQGITVHDCGSCVSNRYTLEFGDGSALADRILEGIPPHSESPRDPYGVNMLSIGRMYESMPA